MSLDPFLLEILACPEDKGPLLYFPDEQALYNPRLRRRYRIEDGIPVLLVEEAETVDEAEHRRLLAKAEAEGIRPNFDPDVPPRSWKESAEAEAPREGGTGAEGGA